MNSLKTILAAIDFGRASESALAQAVRMAGWNRASVHAVHVIDTRVVLEVREVLTSFQQDIQSALEADAMERWGRFATALPGREGVQFRAMVNNPRVAVIRLADELKADLLVMGVRGDESSGRGPGPVATACIEHSRCPVLLASDDHPGAFRQVLACVDFSRTSLRALADAARVALQDSAALHVLHVYRAPWRHSRLAVFQGVDAAARERAVAVLRAKVQAVCDSLGDEFRYLKPHIDVVEHDSHGRGIMEHAKKINADLVALGTQGHTNLREVLLGSTAERVIGGADRSVLVVPPL